MKARTLDLITMGRVGLDLFAQNVGAPFEQVTGFDAAVGGSPVNIAIGASRLGLKAAAFTAVGEDLVGDFVLRYLAGEGVSTAYIPRKPGCRTGLALVSIQPPDRFPLVFYRDNPADIYLTVDDAAALPLASTRALQVSGTALSRGSCRDAVLFAIEQCSDLPVTVFMDLDLRPDQWSHPRAFGLNIRPLLPRLDVVIGTEEEFHALLAEDPSRAARIGRLTRAEAGRLEALLQEQLAEAVGPQALVLKRGERGASVYTRQGEVIHAPGFPVTVLNTVGAGDAFASGLIYGFLQGWDWYRCARMGNACGALVVTRHGCAAALPSQHEALAFIEEHGGF